MIEEVDLPIDILITIISVKTANDLKNATVNISVLPFEKKDAALKILISNKAEIQKALGEKLTIKFTPKIYFTIDDTEQKAEEIENLLNSL